MNQIEMLKRIFALIPNLREMEIEGVTLGEIELQKFVNDNILKTDSQLLSLLMPIVGKEFNGGKLRGSDKLKIDVINTIRYVKGFIPKDFTINSDKSLEWLIKFVSDNGKEVACKNVPPMSKSNALELCEYNNTMNDLEGKRFIVEKLGKEGGYALDLKNRILFKGKEIRPVYELIVFLTLDFKMSEITERNGFLLDIIGFLQERTANYGKL